MESSPVKGNNNNSVLENPSNKNTRDIRENAMIGILVILLITAAFGIAAIVGGILGDKDGKSFLKLHKTPTIIIGAVMFIVGVISISLIVYGLIKINNKDKNHYAHYYVSAKGPYQTSLEDDSQFPAFPPKRESRSK